MSAERKNILRPGISFPDPDLLEAVDRAAKNDGVSRSEFVRRVLAHKLNYQSTYVPYLRDTTTE